MILIYICSYAPFFDLGTQFIMLKLPNTHGNFNSYMGMISNDVVCMAPKMYTSALNLKLPDTPHVLKWPKYQDQ